MAERALLKDERTSKGLCCTCKWRGGAAWVQAMYNKWRSVGWFTWLKLWTDDTRLESKCWYESILWLHAHLNPFKLLRQQPNMAGEYH